jgi:hypothetical protein
VGSGRLQHTPSTHVPDAQSVVVEQDAPMPAAETFTLNVICDWFCALSLAVQVTVVSPIGKRLPDAGVQVGVIHEAPKLTHKNELLQSI